LADIYVVLPLTADSAAKLAGMGVPHPAPPGEPRTPTPREVIAAVSVLTGLAVTVLRFPDKQRVRIEVEPPEVGTSRPVGSGTEVGLTGVTDDDTPCRVTFRGGSPDLLAAITDRIAAACGPQVIWPASGEVPIVCGGEHEHAEPAAAPDCR
jgi:hypothetical protein